MVQPRHLRDGGSSPSTRPPCLLLGPAFPILPTLSPIPPLPGLPRPFPWPPQLTGHCSCVGLTSLPPCHLQPSATSLLHSLGDTVTSSDQALRPGCSPCPGMASPHAGQAGASGDQHAATWLVWGSPRGGVSEGLPPCTRVLSHCLGGARRPLLPHGLPVLPPCPHLASHQPLLSRSAPCSATPEGLSPGPSPSLRPLLSPISTERGALGVARPLPVQCQAALGPMSTVSRASLTQAQLVLNKTPSFPPPVAL